MACCCWSTRKSYRKGLRLNSRCAVLALRELNKYSPRKVDSIIKKINEYAKYKE